MDFGKVIGTRAEVDKMDDVLLIARELTLCRSNNCGPSAFKDPVLRINSDALHLWISDQKITAMTLLVRK